MGVGSNSLSDESATDVALGVKATFGCDDVDGGGCLKSKFRFAMYDGGPAIVRVGGGGQFWFTMGMSRTRCRTLYQRS
jgi:hypothetical protein